MLIKKMHKKAARNEKAISREDIATELGNLFSVQEKGLCIQFYYRLSMWLRFLKGKA